RLLRLRFHGNRTHVFVAKRFEQSLGVGAIGLVPGHVRAHGVRRDEDDVVPGGLSAAPPEMGGATGLEHHGRRLTLPEEPRKTGTGEPMAFGDATGLARHRNFEHGRRYIDRNRRILHVGLLLPRATWMKATLAPRCRASRGRSPFHHVNATVRPFTPLAVASGAPGRPARYALR